MSGVETLDKLRWLGHDSFLFVGPPVVYFDPWRLGEGLPVADIVLVSHEHGDHCSPQDVASVAGRDTVIIANVGAGAQLQGKVEVLQPGESIVIGGVTVEAVPAYNVDKFRSPGNPFHPKPALHNGYILTIGEERIYFAGDTDHIPEMKDIDCDVALLPVSGTYVMTAEEAAEAATSIRPRIAIPMHYGADVAGTASDAEKFRELCQGTVYVFGSE
jgi:L-ascorbate metabolism protein UlaG (beta-lactamase superfamily)